MTNQNFSTLIPKRGRPTELEVEHCYLMSGGSNKTPDFQHKRLYQPDEIPQSAWGNDEWYVAFLIAEPQKLVVREYQWGTRRIWVEDGMTVDECYIRTGRILEDTQ